MLKARLAAVDPTTARQKVAVQVIAVPQRSASLDSLDSLSGSDDDEDAGTQKLSNGSVFLLEATTVVFPLPCWPCVHGDVVETGLG